MLENDPFVVIHVKAESVTAMTSSPAATIRIGTRSTVLPQATMIRASTASTRSVTG